MLNHLWERYFFKQFISIFFFFLFCFYSLYVLIDYASHTGKVANQSFYIGWDEVFRYYFYVFSARAEFLIPLALLIAFVKTILTLNTHQELVALMASGISLKRLLRPFIIGAFFCMLLLYANEEWLLPTALKKMKQLEASLKHQNKKKIEQAAIKHLILEDGSLLLYQYYDAAREHFFDVYWIPSADRLYRIKFLTASVEAPVGTYVDFIERDFTGELLQKESKNERYFPEIHFSKKILESTIIHPEILPLSSLTKQALPLFHSSLDEKESKIMTAFYWKWTLPLLCLLVILGPARSCMNFSRRLPLFLLYVLSLFSFISFYMFMDAIQILAIKQILSPFTAIFLPIFSLFLFYSWRYLRL